MSITIPTQTVDNDPDSSTPSSTATSGAGVTLWAKTNAVGRGFKMYVYYTTDGSFPEGAGGTGIGTTQVAQMTYHHNASDGNNWWTGTIAAKPAGQLRFIRSAFLEIRSAAPRRLPCFPSGAAQVAQKVNMMTTFQITNFNAATALVYPHNDYGVSQTGLSQGFHVLRTREFLNRAGRGRPSTTPSVQTFYYDTQFRRGRSFSRPRTTPWAQGQYGVVVRADQSVTEVDYKIVDSATQRMTTRPPAVANGNNAWVAATQLTANPSVPSTYPNEWRFNYVNIPASGQAPDPGAPEETFFLRG